MWFLALAALAAEFNPSWLIDRPGTPVARFFDGGSGLWPASFGVLTLLAGFYGLVGLWDFESTDWVLYCIEGGLGSYLLKRTFAVT